MPDWPKRGIWVPTWLLTATDEKGNPLPSTVRDTWVVLKAIAAGAETLDISFADVNQMTGKHRSSVIAHLALLRDRCGLRFCTAGSDHLRVLDFGNGASVMSAKSRNPESRNPDLTVKRVFKNPEAEIQKSGFQNSGLPSEKPDLEISGIFHGGKLTDQLTRCYESMSPRRRPPGRFKTVQQRDAFEGAARALGDEFEPLVVAAITRSRYALGDMLAFLETCVKNRANGNGGLTPVSNWRLPDGV